MYSILGEWFCTTRGSPLKETCNRIENETRTQNTNENDESILD